MKYNNDALLELCRYLLPEDSTLEKEVFLSIEKPQTFLSQIQVLLKDWIKNESIVDSIPWYTFIHGLYQRGLIFELSARTIAEGLEHHSKKLFIDNLIRDNNQPYLSKNSFHIVDTFLTLTGEYLLSANYMLGELRLSSGISLITIISQQMADKCVKLVSQSGYGKLVLYPSSTCIHQMDHLLMKDHVCEKHEKPSSLPV